MAEFGNDLMYFNRSAAIPTELEQVIKRWVDAKREQVLREDSRGELIAAVRSAERDVEDAIHDELEAESAGK